MRIPYLEHLLPTQAAMVLMEVFLVKWRATNRILMDTILEWKDISMPYTWSFADIQERQWLHKYW